MKAVLTEERFTDPEWIYERKLDGIRCVAIRDGGPVKLLSRNDLSLERLATPHRRRPRARPNPASPIDGEVVAFRARRRASSRRPPRAKIFYYVFDITLAGRRGRPLRGPCASASGCCATR